jgi:hypothetical protein
MNSNLAFENWQDEDSPDYLWRVVTENSQTFEVDLIQWYDSLEAAQQFIEETIDRRPYVKLRSITKYKAHG